MGKQVFTRFEFRMSLGVISYTAPSVSTVKSVNKCLSSHLAVVFAQSIEARCEVENEDVVGAMLTGDAPTTFKWSTILLPIEVHNLY